MARPVPKYTLILLTLGLLIITTGCNSGATSPQRQIGSANSTGKCLTESASSQPGLAIDFFETNHSLLKKSASLEPRSQIVQHLRQKFNSNPTYRALKAQIIYDSSSGLPHHLLVHKLVKGYHRVDVDRIELDASFTLGAVTTNYALSHDDFSQQPGATHAQPVCPDPTVQFIAFAPNNDTLEQNSTASVIAAAQKAGLKTVSLLLSNATASSYIGYMACPNLIGNFYDGDANPNEITTADGTISYSDFSTLLAGAFRYKVTNIWLACQAYNDPILTSVQTTAQSRKFAAGINDLLVGPSDSAAACGMIAAIGGTPISDAMNSCIQKNDQTADRWGIGGSGTANFWDGVPQPNQSPSPTPGSTPAPNQLPGSPPLPNTTPIPPNPMIPAKSPCID